MKILAIDDDEDIRWAISLAFDLYWLGSRVWTAPNGVEGLRLLENQRRSISTRYFKRIPRNAG